MSSNAVITVLGSPQEVERRWKERSLPSRGAGSDAAAVRFRPAPGDRGTEIHVDLGDSGSDGNLTERVRELVGSAPAAKVKDDLRRFKALFETGVVPRSDGAPEGELAERKLKQRPAQPLAESELKEVGI
jgi:uncharacterized membrane protein